jgi:UDP-2,3-diacylglucosamine hydrolase
VAHYFASDVHLRFDQADRDRRFHAWLGRLTSADSLIVAGDLCDFWMGARYREVELLRSASLKALAEFRRQGGALGIMAGNHDAWLASFYKSALGAELIHEPHDVTIYGLRLRLVHGHLLGARRFWKSWLESRTFFEAFSMTPRPLANWLDQILTRRNEQTLDADEARHMRIFRNYAESCRDTADLVVIGHVHAPADLVELRPRLIVLGGWQHRTSYLKIDETGVSFHVEEDRTDNSPAAAVAPLSPA